MWEQIIETAVGNGLWAVLFCALLLYQLRDGRVREEKYRTAIDALLDRLGVVEEIKRGVDETVTLLRRGTCRKSAADTVAVSGGKAENIDV